MTFERGSDGELASAEWQGVPDPCMELKNGKHEIQMIGHVAE